MTAGRYFLTWMALAVLPAQGVGSWTQITHNAPGTVSLMLLLPDGTVMAANSDESSAWYRLIPDIHGSYVNGTWTTLAAMHDTRLYYSSEVLTNGQVFVARGRCSTGTAKVGSI